jgi:hypothetical protein
MKIERKNDGRKKSGGSKIIRFIITKKKISCYPNQRMARYFLT